jgi:hypothetical protein
MAMPISVPAESTFSCGKFDAKIPSAKGDQIFPKQTIKILQT